MDDNYDSQEIERLDAEWETLNALRELLGIAAKGPATPSYEQALALGQELAPDLYGIDASLIARAQEPQLVRQYRQKADAISTSSNQKTDPLAVVNKDIDEYEQLVAVKGRRDQLERTLNRLYGVREYFVGRQYTENQILIHDVFKAHRPQLPSPPVDTDSYREYRLPHGGALRIRLLHPDPPEHLTGADLVYEICDPTKRLVRLAFVQYKVWTRDTLYLSGTKNLGKQLNHLAETACVGGLCKSEGLLDPPESYRLPFCAAFLRPTDKLQSPTNKLISRGLHVPVCIANRIRANRVPEADVIERGDLRGCSVSNKIFEEMFNRNMLGSTWISYEDVERVYRDRKILAPDRRIVLHAQEFPLHEAT
jgi:hypothetical protein